MSPGSSAGGLGVGRAALWSFTWAVGVAIGVAMGGWLTVVGGSGSPGTAALDVTHDLVVVPLLAGLVVFAVLFVVRLLLGMLRRSSTRNDS